jgi:hypothetical protein
MCSDSFQFLYEDNFVENDNATKKDNVIFEEEMS